MKKSLLITLLSLFTLFVFTACSDSDDDGPTVTPIDLKNNPLSVHGTYNVDFFGTMPTIGNMGNISTDDALAAKLFYRYVVFRPSPVFGNDVNPSDIKEGNYQQGELLANKAGITIDDLGTATIETQLQIWNSVFNLQKDEAYQYTKYSPLTQEDFASLNGRGVDGRNLTSRTDNPESPFQIILDDDTLKDNQILILLNVKGKQVMGMTINAPTIIILRKVSDAPANINPDQLINPNTTSAEANEVFKEFVPNVYYSNK